MNALLEDLKGFKEALDINTSFDSDENNAGEEFSALAEQLQEIIDKHTPSKRDKMVFHLADMTSGDSDTSEDLDKLIAQSKIDGGVDADNVVDMWEPLEDRYTVEQLLDEIGYIKE